MSVVVVMFLQLIDNDHTCTKLHLEPERAVLQCLESARRSGDELTSITAFVTASPHLL